VTPKFDLLRTPPRLVHLRLTTLNSNLFESPTCYDYRLIARFHRGVRMANGKALICLHLADVADPRRDLGSKLSSNGAQERENIDFR
jgi:hypothetical protein